LAGSATALAILLTRAVGSRAIPVWYPLLDRPLDLIGIQLLAGGPFEQPRELLVGREAKREELGLVVPRV